MFASGEQVICVDDSHPNPLCTFPDGYVVRGSMYTVAGVTVTGGVQIAGLRVYRTLPNLPMDELARHFTEIFFSDDVGWKRHRFRRLHDPEEDSENTSMEDDLELVGTR